MGTGDRIKGKLQEIGGEIKQRVGGATDNPDLQAEGQAQEAEGQGRQFVNQVGGQAQGLGEQIKGKVKNAAGAVTDDEGMQTEGKFDEIKGEIRQKLNE